MPIKNVEQPEFILIDDQLRLRKYYEECAFALSWYQDEETLMLVDGDTAPYDLARLYRMYHFLEQQGEVYFIEYRESAEQAFRPIGDVTFWQKDMPIVIGDTALRGKHLGQKVVQALIERAKQLNYDFLEIGEIYEYNTVSKMLFEHAGFKPFKQTEKGYSYWLALK